MTTETPTSTGRGDVIKGLLVLAVVLVIGVGLVAVFLAGSSKHDIKGDLTLTDSAHPYAVDADCQGSGGYSDITAGAEVVVKNGSGKTLGTTTLEAGSGDGTSCVFDFTVKDVPAADFYAIQVSHRGEITFSEKQLKADQWFASLTLGS